MISSEPAVVSGVGYYFCCQLSRLNWEFAVVSQWIFPSYDFISLPLSSWSPNTRESPSLSPCCTWCPRCSTILHSIILINRSLSGNERKRLGWVFSGPKYCIYIIRLGCYIEGEKGDNRKCMYVLIEHVSSVSVWYISIK